MQFTENCLVRCSVLQTHRPKCRMNQKGDINEINNHPVTHVKEVSRCENP